MIWMVLWIVLSIGLGVLVAPCIPHSEDDV